MTRKPSVTGYNPGRYRSVLGLWKTEISTIIPVYYGHINRLPSATKYLIFQAVLPKIIVIYIKNIRLKTSYGTYRFQVQINRILTYESVKKRIKNYQYLYSIKPVYSGFESLDSRCIFVSSRKQNQGGSEEVEKKKMFCL